MKEEKEKERRVDIDNINSLEEGIMTLECYMDEDGEGFYQRFDIAGNGELIIKSLLAVYGRDDSPKVKTLLNTLADNIMILRISEMTGKTPQEVADAAEASALANGAGVVSDGDVAKEGKVIPLAKGGDA